MTTYRCVTHLAKKDSHLAQVGLVSTFERGHALLVQPLAND